jgi:hypothetical protein
MNSSKSAILLILYLFFSCKIVEIKDIPGKYYRKYDQKNNYNRVVTLTLNQDSTFEYTDEWFEINKACMGKWVFATTNTVLLKCFEQPFPALISSGYMNGRQLKVKVISKNKVKVDKSILMRVK